MKKIECFNCFSHWNIRIWDLFRPILYNQASFEL